MPGVLKAARLNNQRQLCSSCARMCSGLLSGQASAMLWPASLLQWCKGKPVALMLATLAVHWKYAALHGVKEVSGICCGWHVLWAGCSSCAEGCNVVSFGQSLSCSGPDGFHNVSASCLPAAACAAAHACAESRDFAHAFLLLIFFPAVHH